MYQVNLDINDKRLCVGYLRVSSKEQLQGYSIENQDITIRRTAEFLGVTIDKVYKDEAKSAFKKNVIRKDFEALIHSIKNNQIKIVVVWKLDRLIRDHIKNEDLFQLFDTYKVKLLSCTENIDFTTADGRKEIRKKGVDNQYESERTSERVSEVLKASASLGNYPKSTVPIGLKRIHNEFKAAPLEIDTVKGNQVLYIFQKMDETKWGVKKMLYWLNASNYMNIQWTEKLLYSLLSDVIYVGTYINCKTNPTLVIKNHTPSLVDQDLFNKIQLQIHSRNYDRKYNYIFKGYIFCSSCRSKLTPNPAHNGKSNKLYQYYHCEKCNKRINQDKLMKMIINEIDSKIDENLNNLIISDYISKLERINYLIDQNDKNLLDLIIKIDDHKKQQKKLLLEKKSIENKLKKYKADNNIYFENLDFYGKRKWIHKYIDFISIDFNFNQYQINYKSINKAEET